MRNGKGKPPMEIPHTIFAIRRYRFYGIIHTCKKQIFICRSKYHFLLIICYKVPKYYDLDTGRLLICSVPSKSPFKIFMLKLMY